MINSVSTPAPTSAASTRPASLRASGWLFITSLPLFVIYLVIGATTMPGDLAADFTSDELGSLVFPWVAINVLWAAAFIVGALAIVRIARAMRPNRIAKVALVLGCATIAAMLVYAALMLSVFGFSAPTLGDDPRHLTATLLSLGAGWASLVGTICIALALRAAGRLRVAGIVFAAIAGLYLLLDIVTWLPVFAGEVRPAEGGGLPPFLIGVLWLALGIVLLRRRVSSVA